VEVVVANTQSHCLVVGLSELTDMLSLRPFSIRGTLEFGVLSVIPRPFLWLFSTPLPHVNPAVALRHHLHPIPSVFPSPSPRNRTSVVVVRNGVGRGGGGDCSPRVWMVFIDVSSCTHISSADVQRHGVALLQIKTTGNESGNKREQRK